MKKVVRALLIGIAGGIAFVYLGGLLLPEHALLTRSRTIAAPPAAVAAQISELRNWPNWSPWHGKDPNMKVEYSTPSAGPGAWYTWKGNKDVGEGKMTLTAVTPDSIAQSMEFGMPGSAAAAFYLQPEGSGTKVTWVFRSTAGNVPLRWMGLMMDRFVGADYEQGLANLAKVTEGGQTAGR